MSKRLPVAAPVLELDVTDSQQLSGFAADLAEHVTQLDGILHSIAYAPMAALGEDFHQVSWPDAATALHVSAWSLAGLTRACLPLLGKGSAVVGLDFDASVAWPMYGWMGVAKGALESCARYLARDLGPRGIRVNLVAAGPLRTPAMRTIPGSDWFGGTWDQRAPLGWDTTCTDAAGRACVALLSDWFPATTGEIVHVDGGFHAVGA